MKTFSKIGFGFLGFFLLAALPLQAQVGQINATPAIERVTVSPEGKLYAWDRKGAVVSGWPIDLTASGRVFSYVPRLQDVDGDLQQEVLCVSEDTAHALRFHVFRGNGMEVSEWRFDLPERNLTETPLIADINHDSSLDLIYGTSTGVFSYRRDFHALGSFTQELGVAAYPVVGDPDNNGLDDLFVASGNHLYHWDDSGAREEFFTLASGESILGAPMFADVTEDAYPEVLFSTSSNHVIGADKNRHKVLDITAPDSLAIKSPLLVEDVDFDLHPEFVFLNDKNQLVALEAGGSLVSSFALEMGGLAGSITGGVVANDLYRGVFASEGLNQGNIYRSRLGGYAHIILGKNVHDWDEDAPFQFIEAVEVNDLLAFPKLFTPNADGVNDTTDIRYSLSQDALVSVDLYDNKERFISKLSDKTPQSVGANHYVWNGIDFRGTLTPSDDRALQTGLYVLKIVVQNKDGFVSTAKVSVVINGIKAEIETPSDDNKVDTVYPSVFGPVGISGIALDPNFGEGNLNADFRSYKLYYRPGVWNALPETDVVTVGNSGSAWMAIPVPLVNQSPTNSENESSDALYPNANVSTRPIQHGLLGVWDTRAIPNGDYTLLLKTLDSNGNTVGKVNYDLVTVTVRNLVPGDPFDASNPFDLNNPSNPRYLGPVISHVALSSSEISRSQPSTTLSYRLENETANINLSIYQIIGSVPGPVVASYSFNRRAVGDYTFLWDGRNTLGRNVNGGVYQMRLTAVGIDGTGSDLDESQTVSVVVGFAASDTLGVDAFTATPNVIRPLSFSGLSPENSSLHFNLTKLARVTMEVYDGNPEDAGVLRKTLISGQVMRVGDVLWDGSAESGLILPTNHDYVVRLTAEGIDIGNPELIHQDITVRLEQQTLNGSLQARISGVRGDSGEDLPNDGIVRSLVGSSDFLWRAGGTGRVDLPYRFDLGGMATNDWLVPYTFESPWVNKRACLTISLGGGGGFGSGGGGIPVQTFTDNISVSVPSRLRITRQSTVDEPGGHAGIFGAITRSAEAVSTSIRASGPWDWASSSGFDLAGCTTTSPYTDGGCPDGTGGVLYNCGRGRLLVEAEETGTCDSPSRSMGWVDRHIQTGDGVVSSGTFSGAWLGTCDGRSVLPGTTRNQRYYLQLSSHINGRDIVSAVNNGGSDGGYVHVPGITGWLGNASGPQVSAGRYTSPNFFASLDNWRAGYDTVRDDPYLASAPFHKIYGFYQDFNDDAFHRQTDVINIYNDGYLPNIFTGDPGTNFYTFSDAVRISSWSIDVRYPNVSVTKPDGDNALESGAGALGIFRVTDLSTNGTGVVGSLNTNTRDGFRLQLLPNSIPKRFVEIHGSAEAGYQLFYYDNDAHTPLWHEIEPRTINPVTDGILAHWDVTRLNGENYTVLVRSRNASTGDVNEDTFNVGIGQRVMPGTETRVYSPYRQASLIFQANTLRSAAELVTITPVRTSEADFHVPSGITPIGPIFDISPEGTSIDPLYPVQLELTFTRDELRDVFHVDDPSSLTIYNLADDDVLEGLATVVQVDGDLYRFTANLEHFSQYLLVNRQAGVIYAMSPRMDQTYRGTIAIQGQVESVVRRDRLVAGPLASITSLRITASPIDRPTEIIPICSLTTAVFDCSWNTTSLNGNYRITWVASGPAGPDARKEMDVAIDQTAASTRLLIDGQALANGAAATISPTSLVEFFSRDGEGSSWESGVAEIHYRIDGGVEQTYAAPFTLNSLSLGLHELEYESIDRNGNREETRTAHVTVANALEGTDAEATNLALTIEGPNYTEVSQTWVSGETQFRLVATPASAQIRYRMGGDDFLIYRGPFDIASPGSDGLVSLQYFAVNEFGLRERPQQRSLLLDQTSPVTEISYEGLTRLQSDVLMISPETRFTLSAHDEGRQPAGLSRIEYRTDGGIWRRYTVPFSIPVSTADVSLEYRSVDRVENVEEARTLRIRFDHSAPALTLMNPPSAFSPNGDSVKDTAEFPITISDNFSAHLYASLTVTDALGVAHPVLTDIPLDRTLSPLVLSWDGRSAGRMLPQGLYTYRLTIHDDQGNDSIPATGSVVLDLTPPDIRLSGSSVIGFSPNGDGARDVLHVNYEVTDNLSNDDIQVRLRVLTGDFELTRIEETLSSPPSSHETAWGGLNLASNPSFDGTYHFQLVAEDPAGNVSDPLTSSATSTGTIVVDRLPPQTRLTLSMPSYNDGMVQWLGRGSRISLAAQDPTPGSGVGVIDYQFGSDPWARYTSPISLGVENVDFPFHYRATDNTGNQEASRAALVRSDLTSPVSLATISTPQQRVGDQLWISLRSRIDIRADDGVGSGVENIYLRLSDRSESITYEEGFGLEGLSDGHHLIYYYAKDNVENQEDAHEIDVWLDQTAPVTHIEVEGLSYQARGTLYLDPSSVVNFVVTSERGDVQRTEYQRDSLGWMVSNSLNVTDVSEGLHSLVYRSFDILGNEEVTHAQPLFIDQTPPTTTLHLSQSSNSSGEGILVVTPDTQATFDVVDEGTGSQRTEYRIDGAEWVAYNGAFNFGGLPPGRHDLHYRSYDYLGHREEEKTSRLDLIHLLFSRQEAVVPRVLVYQLQEFDLLTSDTRPNRERIETALTQAGAYYRIVNNLESFLYELRTDRYHTFILGTDATKIQFAAEDAIATVFREIKTRVHKGDTLISEVDYALPEGSPWTEFLEDFQPDPDQVREDIRSQLPEPMDFLGYGNGTWIRIRSDLGRHGEAATIESGLKHMILSMVPTIGSLNGGDVTDYRLTFKNLSGREAVVQLRENFPQGGWIKLSSQAAEVVATNRELTLTLNPGEEKRVDYLYRLPQRQGDFTIEADALVRWSDGLESHYIFNRDVSAQRDLRGLLSESVSFSVSATDIDASVSALENVLRSVSLSQSPAQTQEAIGVDIARLLESRFQVTGNRESLLFSVDEVVESLGVEYVLRDLNRAVSVDPNTGTDFNQNTTQHVESGGCSLIP